jgi:NarL family two-component system response regulator LiaR
MRILIIDNHVLFREGVISWLETQQGMEVVGESDMSYAAVQKAVESRPDVILMDPGFLHSESISLMKKIHAQHPDVSFIILSNQNSVERFYEMVWNGAKGYLPKNVNEPVLLASLRALERGEAVIPRNLVTKVVDEFARLGKLVSNHSTEEDLRLLTYRELEVLRSLGERTTNREIARQLGISENTVRVHVGNVLSKLKLRNRREACEFAWRTDLLGSALMAGRRIHDNKPSALTTRSSS